MEGFGEKSCENLLKSIETGQKYHAGPRLIYSLGNSKHRTGQCKSDLPGIFTRIWEKLKNSTLQKS